MVYDSSHIIETWVFQNGCLFLELDSVLCTNMFFPYIYMKNKSIQMLKKKMLT